MHALASKYTEETYLTYEELRSKFLPAQMEAIWNEIASYRELFAIELLEDKFIVHGIVLQRKHAQAEQKLNRLLREGKHVGFDMDKLGISGEIIESFKRKYEQQYSYSLKEMTKELQIEYDCVMKYLDEAHDLPLFIRLFVVLSVTNGWMQRLLLLYLSYETCAHHVLFLLADSEVNQSNANDQTKVYTSWLIAVDELLMDLLFQQRNHERATYLKELRLLERYPTLKPYQATFFEQHREQGHYYTVEQFLLYCNTCYETARISMEEFVRLGWYKKEKCGKKYIYYVAN